MGPIETATREAKRRRDQIFFPQILVPKAAPVATPKPPVATPKPPLLSTHIIDSVASKFQISTFNLLKGARTQETFSARYAAIFLLRTLTRLTLMRISDLMNCDESAVRYGMNRATALLSDDETFARQIQELVAAASDKFAARRNLNGTQG